MVRRPNCGAAVTFTSVVICPAVVTLNTLPALLRPPLFVVPYKTPPAPAARAPFGVVPRALPVVPVKLTSELKTPPDETWKIVPKPPLPPVCVVP